MLQGAQEDFKTYVQLTLCQFEAGRKSELNTYSLSP